MNRAWILMFVAAAPLLVFAQDSALSRRAAVNPIHPQCRRRRWRRVTVGADMTRALHRGRLGDERNGQRDQCRGGL